MSSYQSVIGSVNRDTDIKESTKKKKLYAQMKTTYKVEKSRQNARECRARKNLRYQYLDSMIAEREKVIDLLREEMMKYVGWCQIRDQNAVSEELQAFMHFEYHQS